MDNGIICLNKISLRNFKNIHNGCISFNKNSDRETLNHVTGIYGQNGSGKTSIVDSLLLLKKLMSGEPLSNEMVYMISADREKMNINFEFFMILGEEKYRVFYELELSKVEVDNDIDSSESKPIINISGERLSYSKLVEGKYKPKSDLLNYRYENSSTPFTPQKRYKEMVKIDRNNDLDLKFQKEFSKRFCKSYIFNEDNRKIFKRTLTEESEVVKIINSFHYFVKYNLFVIKGDELGATNNLGIMPFSFRIEDNDKMSMGTIPVNLFGISLVKKDRLDLLNKIIEQINIVIKDIIPNLSIELKNYGLELSKNGKHEYKVELVSYRDEVQIPLKYESEGIKKIISILSALIAMYNNEQILLAVDELDAGVFEYLLGEILDVVKDRSKGQFIFTSHNLRALEKLDKDSIVFTTTNPDNRYIKFTSVKSTNNLRDLYLRGILLGGQSEEIYSGSSKSSIARAFRRAWRV